MCVITGWSNSTVSVRDNENNRWKRNAKTSTATATTKNKDRNGAEALVKGWELNDFVVRLS